MKKFLLTCIAVACSLVAVAGELLIEAESFSQRGGWVLDQQFMDQMGSADLSYVLEVARTIGRNMTKYVLVVTKSTVPVGTAGKVRMAIQNVQ